MAKQVRLKIACPVCIDDGRVSRAYTWNHAKDQGPLYLDEYGTIECGDCYHSWFITDSRWGCPDHSRNYYSKHEYEYRQASYDATIFALSQATLLLKGQVTAVWFERLMITLRK